MNIKQQAVLGGIGINVTRRRHPIPNVFHPSVQGERNGRVRVFRNRTEALAYPRRLTLGTDPCFCSDLDVASVSQRSLRSSKPKITRRFSGIADVLKLVDIGIVVVPKGSM